MTNDDKGFKQTADKNKEKCNAKIDKNLGPRLLFNSYRTEIFEWVRTRGVFVLILTFICASFLTALGVSALVWSHFNTNEIMHEPEIFNEVKLYSDEDDIDTNFSTEFDPDKPIFLKAKISSTNLDENENGIKQYKHRKKSNQYSSEHKQFSNIITPRYREESARKKSTTGEQELQELSDLKTLSDEQQKSKKPVDSQSEIDLVKAIDDKIAKTIDANSELRHSIDSTETPAMTLYRVTNAVKAGAVCLDGSPPAYYHRPGTGSSEKLWIIHFNGGAWCFDSKACFERSHSSLGSTKKLPPAPPIIQGINSPDPAVNPDFYDWNLVWVVYCDGASFTGNREQPVINESGETIYMRGKRVLNAIINDLLFNRDFKFAEAIILTGSSAGSMTAIFQADYIASKFPKTIPVRVLSDAGFFIDTAPMGGKNLGTMFKRIYEMQNSSAGLDQDCVLELGEEDAWQCFLPAKIVKFVKTPMFVLNSAYDVWAMIYFLDIDCKFPVSEQQSRRKRSIKRTMISKTDSELDLNYRNKEFDIFMMKRSLQSEHSEKERRDVSGFELPPFFRDKTTRRAKIELSPRPTTKISKVFDRINFYKNLSQLDLVTNESTKVNNVVNSVDNVRLVYPTTVTQHKSSKLEVADTNFQPNKLFSKVSDKAIQNLTSPKEVKQNDKDVKILSGLMNKLGEITQPSALETESEISQNISFSLQKSSPRLLINLTNDINAEKKPSPVVINKTVMITTKEYDNIPLTRSNRSSKLTLPHYLNSSLKRVMPVSVHLVSIKSMIPKLKNSSNSLGNSIDIYDLSRQKKITQISSKRQKIFSIKKPDRLKSRRSTSIAKEYINILRSDPPECTERQLLDAMKYRGAMLRSTEYFMRLPKSGRFLVSCIDHSLSLFDETWTGVTVGGKTIQQAFGDWFYERGNRNKHNFVDCPYPCNPTCP